MLINIHTHTTVFYTPAKKNIRKHIFKKVTFTVTFRNQVSRKKSNKSCTRPMMERTINTSLKGSKEDPINPNKNPNGLFQMFVLT